VIYFLRKINKRIFGKKDKKHVSNLEQALTNLIEAGTIGKEKKEVNSPAVVNKEPVISGEILPQIPSEKTDPIREEKEEKEKPTKESKQKKKRSESRKKINKG
jgi:hypothetical protein